ncbi:hypothetical protein [Streptomyces sp. NRRL B-24484]|uniref:hypothetical protein n=1 Tax=Streptomyces sp. NRRL B-24484 TaxID=1463833 RepID=UPI0006932093|nr:hypothetical protein [Streptomyces sp. NRRL B-24484]
MSQTASTFTRADVASALPPQRTPYLLTPAQGEAARTLLSYVLELPLPGPDTQLLAVVVAIRAARGGVANLTGTDLAALRLGDPAAAVAALRTLGWQIDPALLDGDPAVPVSVSVPDLGRGADRPLPFGKLMRTRVSGWTMRTLNAKPVKKLPPAARLAALLLAAHSTAERLGQVPASFPGACRAAMADLESKGFIVDVTGDRFRLATQVGHLAGMRPLTEDERAMLPPDALTEPQKPVSSRFHIEDHDWSRWKDSVTPALRRHVEAVENCPLCSLARDRVAQAFLLPPCPPPRLYPRTMEAYGPWKAAHPDRGPQAAAFTVSFREKHGHGPSFHQLREGLGWELPRGLQVFVVRRLLANQWLTSTGQVPWTLRPGPAAEAQGIALPSVRGQVQFSHR